MKNIVGHEIYDLGVTNLEDEYRHTWGCCWFQTLIEIITILAVAGGLALILVLAFMLTGQIDASL